MKNRDASVFPLILFQSLFKRWTPRLFIASATSSEQNPVVHSRAQPVLLQPVCSATAHKPSGLGLSAAGDPTPGHWSGFHRHQSLVLLRRLHRAAPTRGRPEL